MRALKAFVTTVLAISAMTAAVASPVLPTSLQQGSLKDPTKPYTLKIEDVISIQVFGQPQVSATVTIGLDGFITGPFVGQIKANGRTVDELRADLTDKFKKILLLRDPIVSVTILQFRKYRASVGGAVQRPITVDFRPGDTVLNLFNQALGANSDTADLRRAFLRHQNSKELIPIDLYAMLTLGDVSQNYELQDGDELTVPEQRTNRVLVFGAIQRPGVVPYREPMTIADVVALSGGEIRYRTRFSKTLVLRPKPGLPGEYLRIPVDFVKFVKSGDQTQNLVIQPGDSVYFAETNSLDLQQINSLVQTAFVFNQLGSIFGFNVTGR